MADSTIECHNHGTALQAFICEHLFDNPKQYWYSAAPSEESQWPDAWCSICHAAYLREGEWCDKNESELKIKLICHRCYEAKISEGQRVEV